ncbi:MAG: putative lipid II flippase FtsW [Treponema sp.]|jgi:cell division protein FtsW|nr:putative lipid II flippase FtsW [Treponema sp.]
MYQFEAEKSPRIAGEHNFLIAAVFLLTGFGLVTLYSASYAFAVRFYGGDGLHLVSQQLKAAAVGMVGFLLASQVNLGSLRKLSFLFVIITMVLCLLTFAPGIGDIRNGAKRWIKLPGDQTFQPSELVKLVLPLYLAHLFDEKQNRLDKISTGVLPQVLITAAFFTIIYMQNNFSTAIFIVINALIVFFLGGFRLRYFFSASIIIVPLSGLLVLTKEHRLRRLISFFQPEWELQGTGFQAKNSVDAIVTGGFWGKGLGQGTRKILSIPEVHSDFIFASFAEELGFVGIVFFFALFGLFAYLGYRGALRAPDTFRRLLGCSLVTSIVTQVMVNIGVASRFVPVTGLPLPFFSAGGSSLLSTLLMAGLVVNVCRSRKDYRSRGFSRNGAGEAAYAG